MNTSVWLLPPSYTIPPRIKPGALFIHSNAYETLQSRVLPPRFSAPGSPTGLSFSDLKTSLNDIPGVNAVHDLHVWSLTVGTTALSVHLVIGENANEIPNPSHSLASNISAGQLLDSKVTWVTSFDLRGKITCPELTNQRSASVSKTNQSEQHLIGRPRTLGQQTCALRFLSTDLCLCLFVPLFVRSLVCSFLCLVRSSFADDDYSSQSVLEEASSVCSQQFDIQHSTIQVERSSERTTECTSRCQDPKDLKWILGGDWRLASGTRASIQGEDRHEAEVRLWKIHLAQSIFWTLTAGLRPFQVGQIALCKQGETIIWETFWGQLVG